MLENLQNYYRFDELIRTGNLDINVSEIDQFNWENWYNGLLNVMKDGIESEFVQKSKVTLIFSDGRSCRVTLIDLYFNLIMWQMIVRTGNEIMPKHLFFDKAITKGTIKSYIDDLVIIPNRKTMDFKLLNNIIDDALYHFMDVDKFSLFLASTINLEDFVNLMEVSPEFDELMHCDLTGVQIEDVKDAGMDITRRAVDIISNSKQLMGYDHCLADSFRSKEGTNIKQYKEFAHNVGTKPDGHGGAFPIQVNGSYLNACLKELANQFIDSSASRLAQIITKNNVGDSGNFARVVGLNSIDSIILDDPEYSCRTKNYLRVYIKNEQYLKIYTDRWFKYNKSDDIEYLCDGKDKSLIGQTLYFRSPVFCESASNGHGICFRCYGMLAYNNRHINAGKMASEIFTSQTTQMRLSAKHLLETTIKKLIWNENFYTFMETTSDTIGLKSTLEFTPNWFVVINKKDIINDNDNDIKDDDETIDIESDDISYDRFITKFAICNDTGEFYEIQGLNEQYPIYLSNLVKAIINNEPKDQVKLPFDEIEDSPLFYIKIENNELGKSLDDIKALMDKEDVTSSHDVHSLIQAINEAAIGSLDVMAVHFEVLVMNQIRSIESNLKTPDWSIEDQDYNLLTLKRSLMDNPSVTKSLLFQKLNAALINPNTYKKTAPSFMDVFFMREPQNFMRNTDELIDTEKKQEWINPIIRLHKK